VLGSLPHDARETLVALEEEGALRFDIRLRGDGHTTFFVV
jgi:hypothetical protein